MRKLRYLLVGGLFGASLLLGWVTIAHGQSFQTGTNVTVAAGQTMDSTLYAAGSSIDIAGTVNGDVFCAGQNVTISGTVRGDVMCAGQSVSLTGSVSGDIRLVGQNVTLGGHVAGNASLAGQTMIIESRAQIAGDLGIAGQDATLNGTVGRDLAATSNNLIINSAIGRNVKASVQQLTLQSHAVVGGNLAYTSDQDLLKDKAALVRGSVTRSAPPAHENNAGAILGVGLVLALYMLVAFLLLTLVLVLLMPRIFHVATEAARRSLGKTFLVGFLASFIVPVALVTLLFTVVGIPLALFAGLIWLVIVLLAGPFAAYLTGRLLLQNTSVNNAIWTMLLGAAVLGVLNLIPFIGGLVALVALWFGLGTLLLRLWYHYQKPHYQMAAESAAVTAERTRGPRKK